MRKQRFLLCKFICVLKNKNESDVILVMLTYIAISIYAY